jgi:hypothetical protein
MDIIDFVRNFFVLVFVLIRINSTRQAKSVGCFNERFSIDKIAFLKLNLRTSEETDLIQLFLTIAGQAKPFKNTRSFKQYVTLL